MKIIKVWNYLVILFVTIQLTCNCYAQNSGIIAIHQTSVYFSPGQTITVDTEITYSYTLTALGMNVILPEGWSFVSTTLSNTNNIPPKINNNTVSFAWIDNLFPKTLTFSYDIKAPSFAKSDQIIRAEVKYRSGASEEKNQMVIPDPILIQADVDQDGDTYPNSQDDFPNDPTEWLDTDGDGKGNNSDDDDDGDGMLDDWEREHGFPTLVFNANEDPDQDGILNIDEFLNGTPPLNFRPMLPTLISPVNNQVMPLTPTLKTDSFEDANETDTHFATDWQLSKDSRFDTLVYDLKTMNNQLEIRLPDFLLDPNTTYYWRARHYDNYDEFSQWAIGQFRTAERINYDNGVPIDQKVADNADLDRDGIFDNQQESIKSLTSVVGNVQVGIKSEFPEQYTVTIARSIDPVQSIVETDNRPAKMPFGMLAFKIKVAKPGDIAIMTAHYSEPLPENALWYTYDLQKGWQSYRPQLSTDRTTVTLMLKDGGNLDADGISNGVIVDPSGPGIPDSTNSDNTPPKELIDDVDNGSCFIHSILKYE
jgi:hypothetical protein